MTTVHPSLYTDVPDRDDYRRAVAELEADGYEVHGLCTECQWGLVITGKYGTSCSAYGACEYAPG